jgi:ribosomal protein S27AE
MISRMKCGGCGNDTYKLEMRHVSLDSHFSEIRLGCTKCGSVAFLTPISLIKMDWSGEGCPVEKTGNEE